MVDLTRHGHVWIGTSGYSYPHWGDGVFYPPGTPEKTWLSYYASRFQTVEINNSFYRLPTEVAFRRWAQLTPPGFVFAVKGSRYITHIKKLREPAEPVDRFMANARAMGDKLGVVLWQLPANIHADAERLKGFCDVLRDRAAGVRHSFEFRHVSWFDEPVYAVLRKAGHSLCIAESDVWPSGDVVTADHVYVRFHGKPVYGGDYPEAELKSWSERILGWRGQGLDVYAYFNNDTHGFAVKNAYLLRELIGGGDAGGRNARLHDDQRHGRGADYR